MSEREHRNAIHLALYHQRRGAVFTKDKVDETDMTGISPKNALQCALNLELDNWKSLADAYATAKKHSDIVTMETLAQNYFDRQANIIEGIDYLMSLYSIDGIDIDTITHLIDRILSAEFFNIHHPLSLRTLLNRNKKQ